MIDQAQALRIMMNKHEKHPTKIITVASGKGGVGKSSIVLNMAIALNRIGKRTLIIDTDFGFSNIDVMLGVNTQYDLLDVIKHHKKIREIIEIGLNGVQFISGGSGVYELTKLDQSQLMAIVSHLISLEDVADTIIFDTGAGVTDNMLRLINASHETILVTTPEPTAIVDVYALIKIIKEKNGTSRLSLVLNMVRNSKEAAAVMNGLEQIVRKNIDIQLNKLGFIVRDDNMEKAVKMQIPVLVSNPKCVASSNIDQIVKRFMNISVNAPVRLGIAAFLERFIGKKKHSTE